MEDKRLVYSVKDGKTVEGLIDAIKDMLIHSEKMQVQRISGDSASYTVLQARVTGGNIKQFVGMDRAITVRFIRESEKEVCMEIGEAKWVDKGAVFAVSMFVLAPLTITSGIGMYKQHKLPEKIRLAADGYMGLDKRLTYIEPHKSVGEHLNDVANSRAVQKLVAESPKIFAKLFR